MNNDLINNHSSMSSNMYIANEKNPQFDRFIQESYKKNKNKGVLDIQSKGNRTIFFDSDNEKRRSSQKDLLISKTVSKYPTNYAAGPNPYNDGIVQGYFINNRGEPRFNQKTYQEPIREIEFERNEGNPGIMYYRNNAEIGGDEVEYQNEGENEEDIEMQNVNQFEDYSPQKAIGEYNEYIGDGIVRNNIPNYSPNQNVQNVPYYQNKNLNDYNMYNNYNIDYVQMNENEDNQYDIESPIKNYNYNGEPYKRRHILGNLGDSASSEAYANNNNQIQKTPIIDPNQRIYVKPRSKVNNLNLHGISTEERGIESRIESTNNPNSNMRTFFKKPYHYIDSEENELVKNKFNKKINYDEDSLNVVEPPSYSYNRDKGGKVDLNLMLKNRGRKSNREENEREDEGEDEREEERYGEEEGDGEVEHEQEEEEDIKDNGNNQEVQDAEELKELFVTRIQAFWRGRCTRRIMTLYHDLDEFIYLLSKVHFNHFSDNFYFFINQLFNVYKAQLENDQNEEEENENDDNIDNENNEFDEKENNENNKNYNELLQSNRDYKTSTKKTLNNNDILSVPGETTFGTIKTENQKFKKKRQNNELTFSNDYYNDDVEGNNREYEKHYYTPYQENEDSFNDGSKDQRFSYSSIHSEENSKYFDNEQPAKLSATGKRSIALNKRGNKNGLLSLNKKKDNKLPYSPSISIEKSRGNSSKRYLNDVNQNENTINLSIIQRPKEDLKSPIRTNYFDNEFMYPENENNLELIAKKKSDEQKINDILSNKKLFDKIKNKIGKEINQPKKSELMQNYGESFMIKNKKPIGENLDNNIKNENDVIENEIETNINNLEIIQNEHKNFVLSKLDLEFNEIFIGQDKSLLNKKRLENIMPTNENEIFFEKNNKTLFSDDKTLPSFNNKENNAFTIKNKYPKSEPKGSGFKPENILIENNEFTINESVKTERENGKPKETQKEIIILPSKGNKFVRLRRSKRTKDNYFSIKSNKNDIFNVNKNKVILSEINETNFEIKSEYYYVEAEDNPLPEIIEKKITVNEPSPHINQFNNENIILSHENDININEKKIKKEYLEDIENNELIILSDKKRKKGKKSKESKDINKIEEFTINGEKKNWNELEFIPNEDFIIIKDYEKESEQSSNIEKEDEKNNDISFDIETNELEIIDKKKGKNKNKKDKKDQKEEIVYKHEFRNIEPIQENEMHIMRMRKIRHKKNVSVPMKENNININRINILKEDKEVQIDPIREVRITTKKILKHEKVLSKKKFLNNKKTSENSLSFDGIMNGIGNKNRYNFDAESLLKAPNVQISYKRAKKIKKENQAETPKEFNTLVPSTNDEFNINKKKKKTKEEETEIDADLFGNEQYIIKVNKANLKSINNENISIKGKKRKKMVEESTEMGKDDFRFNTNDRNKNNAIIKGDKLDIVVPKKEKKEIILEKNNINDINLESRNRAFPRLDMNKCLDQEFIGKEKESKNKELKYAQNEAISFESKQNIKNEKEKKYYIENNQIFISKYKKENKVEEGKLKGKETAERPKKKKMKESETQIDDDLKNNIKEKNDESKAKISLENVKNESLTYKPHKKERKYYIDSNQFLIKTKKNKKEKEVKSSFNKLNIDNCQEQNITIKKKKKKKKTKESETQMDENDFKMNENAQEESDSNKLRGQKKEKKEEKMNYLIDLNNQINIKGRKKKKVPLKQEKKEDINYSPTKANKIFSTLEMNKCEEKTISGKEKEPIIFENIKNDSIEIKSKKNKKVETETQIEKNELKLDFVPEKNDIFSLKSKKANNIIVKNKRFIIKDEQKQSKNGFDNLELAFSETIEIKTQKDYDRSDSQPKKVFDIANLSQAKEESLEMKGKPEIKKEPEIDMGKINNMVQKKLDEEKCKNMDNTKNKLLEVFKAVKLKNAISKNAQNKKYFMDKLKEIKNNKDDKKILSFGNAININYLSSKAEKFESCTDTDYLDEMLDDLKKKKITIEKNNTIEIIEEKSKKEFVPLFDKKDQFSIKDKKKRYKENETEITEELNRIEIEPIKSLKFSLINNKDMDQDEDEKDENINSKKVVHRQSKSVSVDSLSPRTYSESKENDLNISGISKDTVDKEVQIDPVKEYKITTKKIVKKEVSTKKKFMNNKINNDNSFSLISSIETKNKNEEKSSNDVISDNKKKVETCDVMTQTPKLRPAKKAAQKVVYHEIKTIIKKEQMGVNKYEIDHVNKLKFIGNGSNLKEKPKKIELLEDLKESALNNEDKNDYDKVFKLEKLNNLLYINKKIDTLKMISFMKWANLPKNEDIKREDIKEMKNFFSKYHKIFVDKLLCFFDQFAKKLSISEACNIIKKIYWRKIYKEIRKYSQMNNKKENKSISQDTLRKKKLAFEKLNSILKRKVGKYFFSLYKST